MSATLYIFIDESGNPSDDSYYVVGATWCISERNDPNDVLRSTVDKLIATAESQLENTDNLPEIKCSKLPTEVINTTGSCLNRFEYDDQTIEHTNLPWQITYPIRFSIHSTNPQIGTDILSDLIGNFDTSVFAIKALSLSTVLNPIFQDGIVDTSVVNEIRVILDASTWVGPSKKMERILEDIGVPTTSISFETRDSAAVPGLQIADLAAYSWARHERKSDCGPAVDLIDQMRFAKE